MDAPRKLIVGYDLCEDFTQISCYSYKTYEPIPIGIREEDEQNLIPTALCVKTDTRQWLFGEEAISCSASEAGVLIDHLLEKLVSGKSVELFGESFDGVTLLEKFIRKTLTLVKRYFPTEQITKLVVTVRSTEPRLVEGIYTAFSALGLEKDRVLILSHAGAYLYYALSQDKTLWMNDVSLFDFSVEALLYYQIRLNRRGKPIIASLSKTDYTGMLNYPMLGLKENNPSYIFENIANAALYKQMVTTLYFTGRGFAGGWAEEAVRKLCAGRRVFLGQNLFTKGACYAAKELSGDVSLSDVLLLNDDMITSTVGVRVYQDTRYVDAVLANAGSNWYEVDQSIEVIPEGEPELEIILKSVLNREVVREKVHLTKLPERPDRMTRLEIRMTCKDRATGIIRVQDLGFGEFYSATGPVMEFSIEL